ncbi:glycosyltransferase family 2 protein [Candidatus Pelagibacter sp.]|nr:glycosyltransferase family 2 protein [Candidatus Pelagibacter sp.]
MKKIKISILIANYNGEKYLRRCINSCLSQNTKSRFEIIFIDDNSTDSSLAIVKEFKKKLRLIKTKKKKNISKFNTYYQLNSYYHGFIKSRGEIICFLDSDDYLKKNKLSKIDYYFSRYKNLDFIFDRPKIINLKGIISRNSKNYSFRENKWPLFPPQSCISVKRKTIQKNIGKLFKKKFPLTTLDFRIAALSDQFRKNTFFLNNELTYYFQHDDNESNKNFSLFNSNWLKRRLEGFDYYENVNKKKIRNLDYYITKIINIFF